MTFPSGGFCFGRKNSEARKVSSQLKTWMESVSHRDLDASANIRPVECFTLF